MYLLSVLCTCPRIVKGNVTRRLLLRDGSVYWNGRHGFLTLGNHFSWGASGTSHFSCFLPGPWGHILPLPLAADWSRLPVASQAEEGPVEMDRIDRLCAHAQNSSSFVSPLPNSGLSRLAWPDEAAS